MYTETKIDETEEFEIRKSTPTYACPVCGIKSNTISELVKIGVYRIFRGSWPAGSSVDIERRQISKKFNGVICPNVKAEWHRKLKKKIEKMQKIHPERHKRKK